MVALKSITDLVDTDTPTQDEFLKNLNLASETLQEKLTAAVDFFAGSDTPLPGDASPAL